jgi:hypothetical protein
MCIKVVAEADGGGATPSVVVDAVWHTHLMHTRSYHRLCAELGQAYVHHEPSLVRVCGCAPVPVRVSVVLLCGRGCVLVGR